MSVVNVHDAKTNLSKLLERVEAGESITIARAGKPIADLVPHHHVDIIWGRLSGVVVYDSESFDDVDDEIVAAFEGRS